MLGLSSGKEGLFRQLAELVLRLGGLVLQQGGLVQLYEFSDGRLRLRRIRLYAPLLFANANKELAAILGANFFFK